MNAKPNIELWNKYSADHWLRDYGLTEVIVIDDMIKNEDDLKIPPNTRNPLKERLNCKFVFYGQDDQRKWDIPWFKAELARIKEQCKRPAIIFLDLMYGPNQKTPEEGSGINFLEIIKEVRKEDEYFSDIPVIIHTAGQQSDSLVQKLKDSGSCQGFLEKGYNAAQLEDYLLEFALLSDPHIHAYSKSMRIVAQDLRKLVLDNSLTNTIRIQGKEFRLPISVLLVGNSGDGKNYLATYLVSISPRRGMPSPEMAFSAVSRPEDVEAPLFGAIPYSGAATYYVCNRLTGAVVRNIQNHGKAYLRPEEFILSIVGMITYADHGTIILNELGNASQSMQPKLLRFLDDRQIKPHSYSEFIPIERPYDIWVIMTMQPSHVLGDLSTRMDLMRRIDIPSLAYREEDVIPLSVHTLDNDMTKKPEDLFRPEALNWLKTNTSTLSIRTLTGLIGKLKFESSIGNYNVEDLESAYKKTQKEQGTIPASHAADSQKSNETNSFTPAPEEMETKYARNRDRSFRANMLHDLKTTLADQTRECVRSIADYTLWAIEQRRKTNTTPNYPGAWLFMTGEEKSDKSTEVQRDIGDIIFNGLTDEEIIERVKDSELLKNAVLTCGGKRNNKERLDRLKSITEALNVRSR